MCKARDTNVEGDDQALVVYLSTWSSARGLVEVKVAPLTLDVVIMYAQKGRGVRSGLFTDYTFGVWDNDQLVPIGKAYSA